MNTRNRYTIGRSTITGLRMAEEVMARDGHVNVLCAVMKSTPAQLMVVMANDNEASRVTSCLASRGNWASVIAFVYLIRVKLK